MDTTKEVETSKNLTLSKSPVGSEDRKYLKIEETGGGGKDRTSSMLDVLQ